MIESDNTKARMGLKAKNQRQARRVQINIWKTPHQKQSRRHAFYSYVLQLVCGHFTQARPDCRQRNLQRAKRMAIPKSLPKRQYHLLWCGHKPETCNMRGGWVYRGRFLAIRLEISSKQLSCFFWWSPKFLHPLSTMQMVWLQTPNIWRQLPCKPGWLL